MYIIKNAWANLRRNLSRNILLFLLMFTLISASAISIILHTSAKHMIAQYKEQFGSEVILTRNDDLLPKDPSQFMVPDKQMMDKLAASSLLKDVTKTMSSAVILEDIKTINQGNIPKGNSGIVSDNSGIPSDSDPSYTSPNALVFATTNPDISNEFKQGARRIIEGKMYKGKNEGIISKELAEANNLKVQDTITIKLASLGGSSTTPVTQKITITGLYEDHTPAQDPSMQIALTTRANEVFISYASIEDSPVFADGYATYDVFFTLQDPKDLPALEKEFRTLGLPEYYEVTINDAMYQSIVGPVEGMASITASFTIGILVVGVLLLLILSMLSIRERIYEVGVLRAIGMKKKHVIRSFLYESLFITALALVCGLGSAALLNKPIANSVLEVQRSTATTQPNPFMETGLQISNVEASEIKEVPTTFSTEAILEIIAISILLGLFASTMSIVYITRYEPMKILSERN